MIHPPLLVWVTCGLSSLPCKIFAWMQMMKLRGICCHLTGWVGFTLVGFILGSMVSGLCVPSWISHFFFHVISSKSTAYCTLKIVLHISEEQWKLYVDFTWLPTMLPTKCLDSQGIKSHLKRGWSIKPHPFQKHYGMFPRNLCSLRTLHGLHYGKVGRPPCSSQYYGRLAGSM